MGGVVSLAKEAIGFIKEIITGKKEDKLREDRLKKESLARPVAPPKFKYTTKYLRNLYVTDPNDPYSVTGITKSLKAGVLPIGWSLSNLYFAGFKKEADEYLKMKTEQRTSGLNDAKNRLIKIKHKLIGLDFLRDLSEEQIANLIKYKVVDKDFTLNSLVNKLNRFIKKLELAVDTENLQLISLDEIDVLINLVNEKYEQYQMVLGIDQDMIQEQKERDDIIRRRDEKVLALVRRSLGV